MRNLILGLLLLGQLALVGQSEEDILFKVEDINVGVDEFEYIYQKNNRDGADYSDYSLREYLDLYAKFKLKVKKARDLQLDTIPSLQKELEGYRDQLAKSYLNDREVIDRLTQQAYERMQLDVKLAHILIRVPMSASSNVEEAALVKANEAYKRIQDGEDFGRIALEYSNDKATRDNDGVLGYLTALLPSGFYDMENAMYDLKVGEVSEPVRTTLGYHIFKKLDERPARGKVEIAHILARVEDSGSNEAAAQSKIQGVYRKLEEGGDFEELAREHSDDTRTAKRGGYIGKVGISAYDQDFEDAAFALENAGDISEPIRTKVGWHIIMLIRKVPMESYEVEKRKLEAAMAGDERMEIARVEMLKRIKEESGFSVDSAALNGFAAQLGESFHTFKWNKPEMSDDLVISFNDGTGKSLSDYGDYLLSNARRRLQNQSTETPAETALNMFGQFADDACLEYEEKNLVNKYPEFASLMREYEEGILLFEVTKMMVWDKASIDTAGLRTYYEAHKSDYMWPERAHVVSYKVDSLNEKVNMMSYKKAPDMTPEAWAEMLEKDGVSAGYEEKKLSIEQVEERGWKWQEGYITPLLTDPNFGASFSQVLDILPPQPKKLNEARGYVIADYQDHLEKEWVRDLSEEYSVVVNEKLLESLVRKQ